LPRTFFCRTFGNSTGGGGGSPPAQPTISVNSAGTVVTIAGSTAGGTNTVETLSAQTGLGSFTWTTDGSRAGDGAVTITPALADGLYWVRVTSSTAGGSAVSNLVYFRVGTPSGTLAHSPADIIRRVLIALGHGVDPPGTVWPIYAGAEPDLPDNCITCYDTERRGHGRTQTDGEQQEHHGVQVRVRGATHGVGYVKARALALALDQEVYQESVTIAGTAYLVHAVSRTSGVLALGTDTPTSKRRLFTVNVLVSLRSL